MAHVSFKLHVFKHKVMTIFIINFIFKTYLQHQFHQSVLISLYNLQMFSIYKKKSRSQQLQKQLMHQEKEHYKNHLITSNPSHTKPIQKKKKQTVIGHKKKQEDKFSRQFLKDSADNTRPQFDPNFKESADYWHQSLEQWYLGSEGQANACIDEQKNKLTALSSIQELFSLSSSQKLTNQVELECFYRYCRTVSFLQSNDTKMMMLFGEASSGVGEIGFDRQGSPVLNSISLFSCEELQAIEKRASFMEKIKENESKYDASIGRMSEISKELAFNYRIYLQKRTQLIESFNTLSDKIPCTIEKSSFAIKQYAHLLIKKNLKHAFDRSEVDPLNYFKFKEYSQDNRTEFFKYVTNPEQLKMFIDRRKPKRGRKLHLATACSVCLSDYHEMSNPFQACNTCGLRAHALCFNFDNSKCGNCAYQKLERAVKDQVSFCFICKQRGLMTIKFGQKQFAHAFCLLSHGYWKLKSDPKHDAEEDCLMNNSGKSSSEAFLQSGNRNLCKTQIEFMNPNEKCTNVLLPVIDSTIYASHQNLQQVIESQDDASLGRIGIIGQRQEMWQHHEQTKKANCRLCNQSFYKNCYLSCEICQQQTHILCAFLSGFDLKLSKNAFKQSFQGIISMNCCCERSNEVSWSRKYKLNYERMAFNINDTFNASYKGTMQSNRVELLFNI